MPIAQALKAKTKTMQGRKHVTTKSKSRPDKPIETFLRKLNTSSAKSRSGNFKPWFETLRKEGKNRRQVGSAERMERDNRRSAL